MKNKLSLFFTISSLTVFVACTIERPSPKTPDPFSYVTNKEGYKYKAVRIGSQTWLAENLQSLKCVTKAGYKKQEKDSIRTLLPVEKNLQFYLDTNKFDPFVLQWTYNGVDSNKVNFGRLYTYYAAIDSRKICPAGWHVPTAQEWGKMINYLGGDSIAGSKLKGNSPLLWNASLLQNSSNSTLFNAQGGGQKNEYGNFINQFNYGYWWTSTPDQDDPDQAIAYTLHVGSKRISQVSKSKKCALSVRCILD